MSSRPGRDRFRRDYMPPASSPPSSRCKNPPSRHLWVGNLSHHVSERTLADQFLRFGKLENVAFQPGRSYAFINYMREEDAVAAMNSLQDFNVSGLPLKIEFAKADKSSASSRDDTYLQRRDEHRSSSRSSPFTQRESRQRHASPNAYLPESSRPGDDSADHPSEVLWIGFPTFLKVDDTIIRKAFSPFGEIEKITAFPGRSYAFVRFRSLASARRAKETLQGKLFGNPRVRICFARGDEGSSTGGKRSAGLDAPPSPRFRSNARAGSSENFLPDRNFGNISGDPTVRPTRFLNMENNDPDMVSFGRKEPLRSGGNEPYGQRRFHDSGPGMGLPEGPQGYHNSPRVDGGARFREFSPPKLLRSPIPEEPWDLPEDAYLYRGAKKMKTGFFPSDKELPEYPFDDSDQGKRVFPRTYPDLSPSEKPGPLAYKQNPDYPMSLTRPFGDRGDDWRASRDSFQSTRGSFSSNPVELRRMSPELHPPPVKDLWKWEGTIAKGGTPVCRARCFPVGKVMDIMLPEFLDCTARTGLEMLAKHYYQAAGSWVVFFVPASDADIGYYNEFMNYLGEKQRAAVSKLDEVYTLFLVPPSDFSEKVLKVPGKLSISGVVLRLEPASPGVPPPRPAQESKDPSFLYSRVDTPYQRLDSPSGPFPSASSHPGFGKSGLSSPGQGNLPISGPTPVFSSYGRASGSMIDRTEMTRHEYPPDQHAGPNWSPHPPQSSIPGTRDASFQVPQRAVDPITQEYRSISQRGGEESSYMGNYNSGFGGTPLTGGTSKTYVQEARTSASVSLPMGGLQTEQLAQLASSLLGQQQMQPGSSSAVSTSQDFGSSIRLSQPETPLRGPPGYASQPTNQVFSDLPTTQFGLPQQADNVLAAAHNGAGAQGNNQQVPNTAGNGQDEGEADPQKRLQATLQLAAALLQQIQQGKGT